MSRENLPRVLCVDDDPRVVEGVALHLRKDYEVLTALSGEQALQVLKESGGVTVVVADMRMPGMDGATLLYRVMHLHPEVTRILLTGEPGRDAAISAINKAHVFRFLTKPCPPEELKAAIESGVIQHRLVRAERSILKETLIGCIKALTDVLAITNAVAFGRASRVKRLAMQFAETQGCKAFWQLEAASMLSQIGYLALPPKLVEKIYFGEKLTPEEHVLATGVPDVVGSLLENIPRLEPVIQILTALNWTDEQIARLGDGTIGLGTRILGLVLDYDSLITQGQDPNAVMRTLMSRAVRFGKDLVEQFAKHVGVEPSRGRLRDIPLGQVQPGMIIMQDVRTQVGTLLIARGFEVTSVFLERARTFFGPDLLNESVRVAVRTSD